MLSTPTLQCACWFSVTVGADWLTNSAEVVAVARDGVRRLRLDADDRRVWLVDGVHRPELDGCLDVDIAATPVTNTFPIRRLAALRPGTPRTAPVAWVEVPSLRVTRVDQTYRRLRPAAGHAAWEYSDPAHGAFRLTVDEHGLVLDYEGFARRVQR